MKGKIIKILNRGASYYPNNDDKRRFKVYNLILIGLLFIAPFGLIQNLIFGDIKEAIILSFFTLLLLAAFVLNRKGYNQLTVIGFQSISILLMILIVLNTDIQTPAPYGNLIVGLTSILIVKNRPLRIFFIVASTLAFLITNFIQLNSHKFIAAEYAPTTFVIVLIIAIVIYYDHLMVSYQNRIKSQSKSLFSLQKEKHEQAILLKQKDLETILASTFSREQINDNIVNQLKETLKSEDIHGGVNKVIRELGINKDLNDKLKLVKDNIEEVNAEFYQRLSAQFEGITKSERELCAYLKLGLSNKEIATIKNSTENSVNVSKSRLRKKLKMESNKVLQQFLFDY